MFGGSILYRPFPAEPSACWDMQACGSYTFASFYILTTLQSDVHKMYWRTCNVESQQARFLIVYVIVTAGFTVSFRAMDDGVNPVPGFWNLFVIGFGVGGDSLADWQFVSAISFATYALYICHVVLGILLLLNLIIAMMAYSFDDIYNRSEYVCAFISFYSCHITIDAYQPTHHNFTP